MRFFDTNFHLPIKTINRRFTLIFIMQLFICIGILRGSHIVGGEITYKFIQRTDNKIKYHFTMKIYRDRFRSNSMSPLDPFAAIGIYLSTSTGYKLYGDNNSRRTISVPLKEKKIVEKPDNPCLTAPDDIGVEEGIYEWDATLQDTVFSYVISYQRCCRNYTIKNIYNPRDAGSTYTVEITPESQHLNNNSPTFKSFPPIFVCIGEVLKFDHAAADEEADQLVYKFCSPLLGGTTSNPAPSTPTPPPYQTVSFVQPDYTPEKPMNGSPSVVIDPNTGVISGIPNILDQFVVSVCVEEYRAGKLIGKIFRDFQFNVVNCKRTVVSQVLADSSSVSVTNSTGSVRKEYYIYGCENVSVTLTNNSYDRSQITNFYWEFDNKGKIERYTDWSPTVTFKDTGLYIGKLLLNPGSQCGDSAFVKVQLGGRVYTDMKFKYDTCVAGPVNFQGTAVSAYPLKETLWTYSEGKGDTNKLQTSHQFVTPGLKSVKLSAKDRYGCKGDTTMTFNWQPAPPIIIVEPDNFVGCAPGKVFFNNRSKPIDSTYSIKWDFGDSTTGKAISPSHIYEKPGIYPVRLTIISPIGCRKEAFFNNWIRIRPVPKADFDWEPKVISNLKPNITFEDKSTKAANWRWQLGATGYSTKPNPSYIFKDTGDQIIKLYVTNTEGCIDSITKTVYIEPQVTFFMPNAFSPNYDTVNDEFKGTGFIYGLKRFQLTILNRWGEKIFQTDNPTEGWNGQKNNVGQPSPEGIYIYELRYITPKNEVVVKKDFVTLFR